MKPLEFFESHMPKSACEVSVMDPEDFRKSIKDQDVMIYDAHLLEPSLQSSNQAYLNIIADKMATTENIVILCGRPSGMEKVLDSCKPFRDLFVNQFHIPPFNDEEVSKLLYKNLGILCPKLMYFDKVDGWEELIRRIARKRKSGEFTNGWYLSRLANEIFRRYVNRTKNLEVEADEDPEKPKVHSMNRLDLLGPDPSFDLEQCPAWLELQQMVGLEQVKQNILSLRDIAVANIKRESEGLPPLHLPLNRLVLGNPGTGKTTVAKLYGMILKYLGLLSNGDIVYKTPSDFIGSCLGSSESNTKAILSASVGKVLVIDEAYGLYKSGSKTSGSELANNMYQGAVIDTLVSEIRNEPDEDRCVLMLGYKDIMEEMMNNVNPGLARRFQPENAFHLPDYTEEELLEIFNRKLKQKHLTATFDARLAALDALEKEKRRSNFGNTGSVENLIATAFQRKHQTPHENASHSLLLPCHISPTWIPSNENMIQKVSLDDIFKDFVGCDTIIQQLNGYKNSIAMSKALGRDPLMNVPMNFLFVGPPGTGKTTTARKFARIFREFGILSNDEVVEASASDLIAGYCGQTPLKTKNVLRRGLGRVLLIDEAYRLGSGSFGREAIDELVDQITKPEFHGKMLIVLAGYQNEIQTLLDINPGLSSRFSEKIHFQNLSPEHCRVLLDRKLKDQGIHIKENENWNRESSDMFSQLSQTRNWGNGRDVETLAKLVARQAASQCVDMRHGTLNHVSISADLILYLMKKMLEERKYHPEHRECAHEPVASSSQEPPVIRVIAKRRMSLPHSPEPDRIKRKISVSSNENQSSEDESDAGNNCCNVPRDPGVSDEVWQELQTAKENEKKEQEKRKDETKMLSSKLNELRSAQKGIKESLGEDSTLVTTEFLAALDSRIRQYQKYLEERRKEQKKQEDIQKKLREMGLCSAGYKWVHLGNGRYRCEAGGHETTIS